MPWLELFCPCWQYAVYQLASPALCLILCYLVASQFCCLSTPVCDAVSRNTAPVFPSFSLLGSRALTVLLSLSFDSDTEIFG